MEDFIRVVRHLIGLPNVTVEDWSRIDEALTLHGDGLDFADALHLVASRHCGEFASFDDRRFARRVKRLGIKPPVVIPSARREYGNR